MIQQRVPRLLYTVEEAAQALHISRISVYRLFWRGELASIKVGGLRRISTTALEAYVKRLEAESAETGQI